MKHVFRSSLLVLLALVFAVCGAACSGSGGSGEADTTREPTPHKSAQEVYEDVLAVSGFGNMTLVTNRDYAEIYGIDLNKISKEDHVWYVSENVSLNADEVVILRVEKEEYLDTLVTLLQKHLDTRLAVAETYSPEEAAKLKNVEIATAKNSTGLWVYYCVGENYTKMMGVLRTDIG